MIIADDHLDASRRPSSPRPPAGTRSPRACAGARCACRRPVSVRDDGTVDVLAAADRLGMPVVRDDVHAITAIGPGSTTGRTLSTAAAPDPELIDRDGAPFRLSSLHGRKVLLVAWASY